MREEKECGGMISLVPWWCEEDKRGREGIAGMR